MNFTYKPEVSEVEEDVYLYNTQEVKEQPVLPYSYVLVLFNTNKSYLLKFHIGTTNDGNFFSFSIEAF